MALKKRRDHSADMQALYAGVRDGSLGVSEAVRLMRKVSGLTQERFAKHRGISVQALRQVESGDCNPTVETLNAIAAIFGLRVGFVPARKSGPAQQSSAGAHESIEQGEEQFHARTKTAP